MAFGNLAVDQEDELCSTDHPAVRVGNTLKAAREERSLTIAQVASEIRIRKQYLQYLESGKLEELPGQVYVVGFIKTYASFLMLDYVELLRQLNLTREVTYDYSNFNYVIPAQHQESPTKKLLIVSSILVVGVIGLLYYFDSSTLGTSENNQAGIESLISAPESSGVENQSYLAGNESQIQDTFGIQKESLKIETVENQDVSQPQNENVASVVSDETSDTSTPPEKTVEKGISSNKEPVAAKNEQIIVKAVADSWVQIMNGEGKTVYVRLMHAGETYTLPPAAKGYHLNTGNAGGIKLVMGEQETDVLGDTGKVIRGFNLIDAEIIKLLSLKAPDNAG